MPSPSERRAILDRVFARDGGCVAPLIDPSSGPCRDRWGHERPRTLRSAMEFDHVRPEPGGFKPPFDPKFLVTTCAGHHHGGWSTSHRPELREYLSRKENA